MSLLSAIVVSAIAWLSFGVGHSLLAADALRAPMQRWFGKAERLAYNGIALIHLMLVLAICRWAFAGQLPFALAPVVQIGLHAVQLLAVVLLVLALREYDMPLFLGLRQWSQGAAIASQGVSEQLVVIGLHRYVRHPLYSASILLLLASVTDPYTLATALFATVYFVIGLRFEERKLQRLYGAAYQAYRARTPALVPAWGRHHLSA
ncbi:MAG: hypothetical protein KGQ46_06385 [Hyphomicrobiales bacterium]|nr:hypothetical protein [Hyphomicrobiales bacterium]MDE2114237.1 hypothetical protein [Hyphomicrobiales bacterium]